jgi:hypothetical protein
MQKSMVIVSCTVVAVVLLGLAVCFSPAEAQAEWTVYDRFNSFEFTNWEGGGSNNMSAVYTFIREVPKKKNLLLAVEVYGPVGFDEKIWGWNGLRMPYNRAQDVKAIKIDVKVKEHKPACCGDGGECAEAVAELLGSFFHINPTINLCPDGEDPCNPPEGYDGCFPPEAEVHAGIALKTQGLNDPDFSENRLNVRARVWWCETPGSCGCGEEIEGRFIGNVKVGSDNTISMEWNPEGDEVIFKINSDTVQMSYAAFLAAVGGDDDELAQGAFKDLAIGVGGINCSGTRESGYMESAFDNVEIKELD